MSSSKLSRFVLRTAKGIYDILATYLLIFIIPFAIAGFVLHLGFDTLGGWLGWGDAHALFHELESRSGIPSLYLRIAAALPAHVALFYVFRKPWERIQPQLERGFDYVVGGFRRATTSLPRVRAAGEIGFSLVVTLLLVPFVLQPTLVPEFFDGDAWVERAVNLADGTASATLADSVVGFYRRWYDDPIVPERLPESGLDRTFEDAPEDSGPVAAPAPNGTQPLMDRWDPYIAEATKDRPDLFPYVKAFMWVESGGRQYAVSHTGCAGLMQFCSGTARGERFRKIFGVGRIYVCACRHRKCSVPRDVQRELESGDPTAFERHQDSFPCEMTDGRFDPERAIAAGTRYVADLHDAFGGNIHLMYIGYNSGPAVARKVWKRTGENPDVGLAEIEVHLADAMRPHFKSASDRRAKSLVGTHLPKLSKAHGLYVRSEPNDDDAEAPRT